MTDLELAKQVLKEKEASIVLVKNGQIQYMGYGKGIRPLFELYLQEKDLLKGASVADKLTGQAAARLCMAAEVKEVFAYVMSQEADRLLVNAGINHQYDRQVERILNRTGQDLCPIEKIAIKSEDTTSLVTNIEAFLRQVGGNNNERKQ